MKSTQQIIELLKAEPNLNSNEIIQKLSLPESSARQTLYHLHKKGKIQRNQIQRDVKCGPRNIYVYSV